MRRSLVFTVLLAVVVAAAAGGTTTRAECPDGACGVDRPAALGPAFVPGQLLVRFRPGILPSQAMEAMAGEGADEIGQIPALGVRLLRLPPAADVVGAAERLSRSADVEYAEPNYLFRAAQVDDPGLGNQWAPQKIDAPEAWALSEGSPLVPIAVVDTGVDYRHTELAPNIWTNPGEVPGNGADDDGNGYVDDVHGWDFVNGDAVPLDDNSHGTHVAGIAAAAETANPAGLVGVCPACTILAVKVLGADGSGPLDRIASGIVYAADQGAKAINLSLGAEVPIPPAVLESAVNYAWAAGAVVVAAAGNDGKQTSTFYPAACANAVGVASTNAADRRSCYSNWGTSVVSVAAPGEAIYSTLPLDVDGKDRYGTYSGTSMAAPHVSGLAGLLFSYQPGWTNAEVRSAIEATTEDLGPVGPDAFFGTGRVNAFRALTGDTTPVPPPADAQLGTTTTTASGYAHARKLARDGSGTLHLAWHTQEGAEYRVLYSQSADGGATWSPHEVVFASQAETYHPALAVDGAYVYVALPTKDGAASYRILFSRRPLAGGAWSAPVALMGGSYDTVRPDLYVDPGNGRIHCAAASLDNARQVYHTSSGDQGATWGAVHSVDPNPAFSGNSRYADVHAHGDNVYLAVRTVSGTFIVTYYLHTVRSTDGGQTWIEPTKISSYQALTSGEYGVSLSGVGDRLYMVYEVGGNLYFRRWDGAGWSDYLQLESTGRWPTATQAADGQAWMLWEDAGSLLMRHYTGSAWEAKEIILQAGGLNKGYLPNLALGAGGGRVEWVYTHCSGAPFDLVVAGRDVALPDQPPTVDLLSPAGGSTLSGVVPVLISASDAEDPPGTLTVEWRVDDWPWQPAAYDGVTGTYTASWDTASAADGAHTVTARAVDSAANETLDSVGVTVDNNEPPVASFTASCDFLSCHFDASASSDPGGTIAGYGWVFGDGATGSGAVVDHTYGQGGSYLVVLTVTDDDGATGTHSETVSPTPPPATLHVGDLDGYRTKERSRWTAIVTVTVHDAGHEPVGSATVTGTWSNGATGPGTCVTDAGGSCSLSRGAISTRVASVDFTVDSVSHASLGYAPADNHDPEGDSNGTTIRVYLQPPANQPPVASFVYACTGRTCDFDATASTDPDGTISGYGWTWGDGGTGSGATASHTYAADGSYVVVLTVTDNLGATGSQAKTVPVGVAPELHVGDLDGSAVVVNKKFWKATVTIAVHDSGHAPVVGATVWVTWSGIASGSGTCLTDAAGRCTVTSTSLPRGGLAATLAVDDVTLAGYAYAPAGNHDPDGDSDGTSITVGPLP